MKVSRETCNAAGYLFLMYEIATVLCLMAITVNRYIKICHSSKYNKCCGWPGVIASIVGVWTVAALIATPLFPGYSIVPYSPEQVFCISSRTDPTQIYFPKLFVGYCIPLIIMATCYGLIFKHFKDSKDKLRAAVESQSTCTENGFSLKERLKRSRRKMFAMWFFRRIYDSSHLSSTEQIINSTGSKTVSGADTTQDSNIFGPTSARTRVVGPTSSQHRAGSVCCVGSDSSLVCTIDTSVPTPPCYFQVESKQQDSLYEPCNVAPSHSFSDEPVCRRTTQRIRFESADEDTSVPEPFELLEDGMDKENLRIDTQDTIEKSPTAYSFLGSTLDVENKQPDCTYKPYDVAPSHSFSDEAVCRRTAQHIRFENADEDTSVPKPVELLEDGMDKENLRNDTQDTIEKSPTAYSFLGSTLDVENKQPDCTYKPYDSEAPSHSFSDEPLCRGTAQRIRFENSEIHADIEDPSVSETVELPEDGMEEENLRFDRQVTIEKSPTTYSVLGSTLAKYFKCVSLNPESMPAKLRLPVASLKKIRWREEEMRVSTTIFLIIAACVFSFVPGLSVSTVKQLGVLVPTEVSLVTVVFLYANCFYNPIIYGARNPAVLAAYCKLWRDVKSACRRLY